MASVTSDASSVAVTAAVLSILFADADADSIVSTALSAAEPDVPHEASTPTQTMTAAVVAATDRIFFQAIRSIPFLCTSPATLRTKPPLRIRVHVFIYGIRESGKSPPSYPVLFDSAMRADEYLENVMHLHNEQSLVCDTPIRNTFGSINLGSS